MSRIGKKPVELPKGVTASIDGQHVAVKGPKGELARTRDELRRVVQRVALETNAHAALVAGGRDGLHLAQQHLGVVGIGRPAGDDPALAELIELATRPPDAFPRTTVAAGHQFVVRAVHRDFEVHHRILPLDGPAGGAALHRGLLHGPDAEALELDGIHLAGRQQPERLLHAPFGVVADDPVVHHRRDAGPEGTERAERHAHADPPLLQPGAQRRPPGR